MQAGAKGDSKVIPPLRDSLQNFNDKLAAAQGHEPLMHASVTAQTVAEVISGWTGIPVGKMQTDEINAVLCLEGKNRGTQSSASLMRSKQLHNGSAHRARI